MQRQVVQGQQPAADGVPSSSTPTITEMFCVQPKPDQICCIDTSRKIVIFKQPGLWKRLDSTYVWFISFRRLGWTLTGGQLVQTVTVY